jgi:cephalosporin-C deacetylase-like acetyl esterase
VITSGLPLFLGWKLHSAAVRNRTGDWTLLAKHNLKTTSCHWLIGAANFAVLFAFTLGQGTFTEAADDDTIRKLDPAVLSKAWQEQASGMVRERLRRLTKEANTKNRAEWNAIKTKADWERYRDQRIDRLRDVLAEFPAPPKKPNVRTTGIVKGEGYRIENTLYETRPGFWVVANLYVPAKPRKSMPGILIASSHHRDKWQGELQDMGMTWARAGCRVLVIDEVGYGERRAHPFNSAADYDKEYRVSRQDYYHRYDSGVQLHLLGDSLMGWFAWDLMRGVDLLLSLPGTDPNRIIILGAVAGGGDPCGVTAALDPRITAAVPFNFGGPQPEVGYPLPADAETSFNYLGGSYWDSTRGLRRGEAEGYFHWVIVGSIAPRPLIYGQEFAWDRPRDPVWKRFETIWGKFYNQRDRLAFTHGKGGVRGRPPEATHCTNIGAFHRRLIHVAFKKWFDIDVTSETEYSNRRENRELVCLTDAARRDLKPKSLMDAMTAAADERIARARKSLSGKGAEERNAILRRSWSRILGRIEPAGVPKAIDKRAESSIANATVERITLQVEADVVMPLLLLIPKNSKANKSPVVIGLAQAGKAGFLENRSDDIAKLLGSGVAVCLPDLRGTGETKPGSSRGRTSADTGRSTVTELFNETVLGSRLRDLLSVVAYLKTRDNLDSGRLALWGDSFAAVNSQKTNFSVPHGVDDRAKESEPVGGLLALLGGLFVPQVKAVYVNGGLSEFRSVLAHHDVFVPHDAAVPGALSTGDIADLASGLAPRPIRIGNLVDGLNRTVADRDVVSIYKATAVAYRIQRGSSTLTLGGDDSAGTWLSARIRGK